MYTSIIIAWALMSFVAAAIASERKIGFFIVFFASLLFSPLAGILIAFASKRKEDEAHEKKVEELLTALNEALKK